MRFESTPNESLSYEDSLRDVYKKLNEIDRAGYSRNTEEIKKYIEGSFDPGTSGVRMTRLRYLEGQVNQLYADFILREDQKELGEKSDSYVRIYEGKGYHGVGYLEIFRMSEIDFETSEMGEGYTATSDVDPDWLSLDIDRKQPLHKEGTPLEDWGEHANDHYERSYEGKVLGVSALIKLRERSHMNSRYCYSYSFKFKAPNEAKEFQAKLSTIQKENSQVSIQAFRKEVQEVESVEDFVSAEFINPDALRTDSEKKLCIALRDGLVQIAKDPTSTHSRFNMAKYAAIEKLSKLRA